ncbi:hypothetical protein, partial [Streptomyces sp. 2A115]|uniref:hypothetical protein n=1 Tax=Streptomyces sp. 2A115 TaxID=3457439 RepID=UPI003FD106A5
PPEPTLGRTPRGRHRKPRPRRVLFAVGGLALAAGALSLMRLGATSSGGGEGVEAMDVEPGAASSAEDTARDNAGAVVAGVPTASASPSATATMGSAGATPPSGQSARPGQAGRPGPADRAGQAWPGAVRPTATPSGATQGSRPIVTTPPAEEAARQPAPRPPATTPSNAAPAPPSTGTARPPARNPEPSDLCVPIVGLCLDEDR